ncbi:hypothetical protein GGTG_06196 [Gaeumannomyces tritici R3-111a-1]|uniref:Uncharacterized protein n=1 Tax=Gaeumannomyces tritici (strain R3-111a-1) TaxID=644352 RepID=J3NY42_GAET3|nr:hypothetical protein GGTG_06196 [Gaeumannomyces tritici R3-111a-1]EJT76275.1 hypothetical protein GGTG_06196 [Gaeumannomyces tritici R3-111a-1]
MRFGDSIRKLLETYGNCLQLLEVFRRRTDETRPESDAASLLQKSLKSDRDKIERRYASRLSESGRRLARGDDKAKSVLRRTLKKLNAALVDLLHMGKHDDAMLPYDALKRLSNSSRIDAVNAIDQLSHRLASAPSRRSLASSSGVASSSSTSADGHRRRRASASDAGTSIAPHSPTKPPPTKTRKDPGKRSSRKVSKEAVAASKKAHRSSEPKRDSRKLSKSVTSSSTATAPGGGSTGSSSGFTDSHAVGGRNNSTATDGGTGAGATNTAATTTVPTGVSDAHDPTVSSSGSNRDSTRTGTGTSPGINISTSSDHGDDKKRDRKADLEDPFPLRPRSPFRSHRFSRSVANRMSMMTVSSVSTKLGEIPERRRLQRVHGSSAAESGSGEGSEYNVPPTYPLKPYRTPPGSRAKNSGFWGLFSRR